MTFGLVFFCPETQFIPSTPGLPLRTGVFDKPKIRLVFYLPGTAAQRQYVIALARPGIRDYTVPMILSGNEIQKRLGSDIIIKPYDEQQLNPNSYNLRLHDRLLVYRDQQLDMRLDNPADEIGIPAEGLALEPGKLYLGRTVEYTETRNAVPMLEGRSSVGRLGLFIHVTAGFGDVGFCGFWTLEIFCVQPVIIYPGVEICQIYYHHISEDHREYASGKYQGNSGIQTSQLYKDFLK